MLKGDLERPGQISVTDGLSYLLKMINYVENPKNIPTNKLDLIPVDIRCGTKLTILGDIPEYSKYETQHCKFYCRKHTLSRASFDL